MKRLLLPPEYQGEPQFSLAGRDFHHLVRVLRFKAGDKLKATDAAGNLYSVTIAGVTADHADLALEKEFGPRTNAPEIRLVQALPKAKAMDLIVRQATEAGVGRIIPVTSRYSVVKLESEKEEEKKVKRWNMIALEALKQSGMRQVPRIDTPIKLRDMVFEDDSLKLYFHIIESSNTESPTISQSKANEATASSPRYTTLHAALLHDHKIIYICVGPEGGFSNDEAVMLSAQGCVPVFLGENILRAETAALYAVAAVNIIVLEKDVWRKL